MEHLILDIEIQRTIGGPGGLTWDDTDAMGVSVAVLYSVTEDRYTIYGPYDLKALRERLDAADRITTYNGWTFDLPVIYGVKRPGIVEHVRLASDDLLARVWNAMGTREKGWTLGDVAQAMLGRGKIGSGADAPMLYQQGRWAELINYCLEDVRLLRDISLLVELGGEIRNARRSLTLAPWRA